MGQSKKPQPDPDVPPHRTPAADPIAAPLGATCSTPRPSAADIFSEFWPYSDEVDLIDPEDYPAEPVTPFDE